MIIQKKPDYLIFADSAKKGEVTDFPDVSRGWGVTIEQTGSKPPLEWMNGAFNRIDKNMLYLLQQGVPEWSKNVKYPVNAIIKYNGVLYTAIVENDNALPTTSTTKWKKTQEKIVNASTSQSGVVKLSSSIDSTSETEAATSLAVKTVNVNANNAHNKIDEMRDKFELCPAESRVRSHDKRFFLFVRDDGVVGMYNHVSDRAAWAFNFDGSLCEGSVPVERITNLDWFVRNRSVPVGVPMPWPRATPPAGWFECNGSQFNTNLYPHLAAAYPWGSLPDLRGEFIRGWDNGRRADPDRVILSWQVDAIRNIYGTFAATDDNNGDQAATGAFYVKGRSGSGSGGNSTEWMIGMDASRVVPVSHDNHPRNVAFMYIVKAE